MLLGKGYKKKVLNNNAKYISHRITIDIKVEQTYINRGNS